MRLIDAKELEKQVKEVFKENPVVMGMLLRWLRKQPTIDAVPVVRCKDCGHCIDAHGDGYMYCMRPIEAPDYSETGYCYPLEVRVGFYGFCSYGERKDGE